ncbi:MAG TPA: [protein-PII] uridylyltransferase [Kaistiaceae bacterium]|nr:[protein-PII] uridylyltransferase [Kaistiaceae bacterium]
MSKSTVDVSELIDAEALGAEFSALAESNKSESAVRLEITRRLKEVMASSREKAWAMLHKDGGGTLCAERLSLVQDDIIRTIFDFATGHVYRAQNPSAAERISVVAVGGYGRGTLAPGSDIDLLFVLPYKQTPWGESIVEYILYMLWDLGLKVGHATRSIDECIRLSRGDLTIRTAVLEARYIYGDEALYDDLVRRFDEEVVRPSGPEFIAAKLAERDERHRRQGASRYVVEPNVKEGKGGLRDLHTLYWIGKYFYRVRTPGELIKAGVFTRKEYNLFRKCEDFLWAVRCHLHFVTGRAEERLTFDMQPELARRLGYTEHPGLKDVERFMKHYFLVAKDVGDLTRIFCSELEERHAKQTPVLNRFLDTIKRRRHHKIRGSTDFIVDNDRINIADENAFERDPVNIIRVFHLADRYDLAFHPDAMRQITRSLGLVNSRLRDDPEANALFLDIIASKNEPELVLRRMNEAGVLGRFVPDFGKIVAMMQFNMYHHYTVDEHLLRAIGFLSSIEKGQLADEHPLSHEIVSGLANRQVLYLAVFLHDIAKGRPEDHSVAGAKIARRIGPRLGLSRAETDTVAWLVEHHLTMSVYAQSRDLNDRKTINDFAAIVQSLERLKMLLILTVADIRAVGPGVWNGWKGQLLRTLYYETEQVLTGGQSDTTRARRVELAKQELGGALGRWEEADRERYFGLHYPAYWLRVDLPRKISHAHLIAEADAAGRTMATDLTIHAFEGVTELTVLAPDHPRLLSIIAGACSACSANIVDAQIYTTTDGRALDAIFISRAFDDDADEFRRAAKVTKTIESVLRGEAQATSLVTQRAPSKVKAKAFKLEPQVLVTNAWSNLYTVIEVGGLDRPGLLFDLTTAISALNLNIVSAHVATFGERAIDVFYVTDLMGQKITNGNREAAIRRRLVQVFERGTKPEERRPAPKRVGERA